MNVGRYEVLQKNDLKNSATPYKFLDPPLGIETLSLYRVSVKSPQ